MINFLINVPTSGRGAVHFFYVPSRAFKYYVSAIAQILTLLKSMFENMKVVIEEVASSLSIVSENYVWWAKSLLIALTKGIQNCGKHTNIILELCLHKSGDEG